MSVSDICTVINRVYCAQYSNQDPRLCRPLIYFIKFPSDITIASICLYIICIYAQYTPECLFILWNKNNYLRRQLIMNNLSQLRIPATRIIYNQHSARLTKKKRENTELMKKNSLKFPIATWLSEKQKWLNFLSSSWLLPHTYSPVRSEPP